MTYKSAKKTLARSQPEDRLRRLRACFSNLRVDAALVTHLPNVRYLCGFTGSAGILLVEGSKVTLFTDSRYTFQAREEVRGAGIKIAKKGLLRAVGAALRGRRGLTRVAFSSGHMTVAEKAVLEAGSGSNVRWVVDGNAVEKLRAVKDAAELSIMRGSALLISDVFRSTLKLIKPGAIELDLAAEIEFAIKKGGGSGPSFDTIVASGRRSAWAHARPTAKALAKSEFVVLDQGAIMRGYCSDLTRTVHVGRATGRARSIYSGVLEAQQTALQAVRAGVAAGAVDKAARSSLKKRRLDRYFTHSLGHGLGLEIHEMPRLAKGEETILSEGMVVTIEPGVYLEGFGGIRIEDDVVVTKNGCEVLTNAPREFLEL